VAELHGRERDPGVPPQASQASCGDRPPPPGAGAATPPASGMLP
jgi:hypothetical protein